jgi:hypothetical protein
MTSLSGPMVIFGIFDILACAGLIAGLVSVTMMLRPARMIVWDNGGPATVRRARRSATPVALLWIFGAATVLLVLFNVAYFSGADPVIGSPTGTQVTGTWVGDHGARLLLRPDGTFTASGLPPHVGDGKGIFATPGLPKNPASGHGTWIIGPGDFGGSLESVIFTFTCDAAPNGCTGRTMSFDLQAESSSPSGGPALFYYLGDPDDWSDQYPFVREQ